MILNNMNGFLPVTKEEMAERGFLAIAFDPSFTGESSGEPRYMTSFDINVEDFQSAVDFLISLENVDSEKIGIIGIIFIIFGIFYNIFVRLLIIHHCV